MNRTKPTTWSLERKTNQELLFIAMSRLHKHQMRSNWKWKLHNFIWEKVDRRIASKMFADWYAADAIAIVIERNQE